MSYEFRSLNLQSLAYDASTDTPPLAALSNGGQYIVGTQGRVATTTVAGAQDGADAVLLEGDSLQSLDGGYSLVSAAITTTQNVDVGVGGTALFASLADAMAYLAQRTINADVVVTVNLLASYAGVEAVSVAFAHPQSSQIQVLGIAASETISACTGVTGAIGNLAVSYTLAAPITGLAVGDVVIIDQETCTDPQTTTFLGSHCGTWLVSAVAGTAVTVQNIQKMRVTLTNAGFAGARMTKVTKVAEQGDFSNVDKMVVGNLAFHHDLNKYVMVGVNGSILLNGFLGAGSTNASANTTQVVLTEEFDVLSADYQEVVVSGITYTMGLGSVFAPNGGKSAIQVASGQGAIVIGKNINVETLVCGTAVLYADVQSSITCKNKFGSYNSKSGNLFVFVDAGCNSVNGSVWTSGGSAFIVTQTAANSNGFAANTIDSGVMTIVTQTACNLNTTYGNAVSNSGNFYIGTQTSCNANLSAGNSVNNGTFTITTQTACNNNVTYNNLVYNGSMFISTQTACGGSANGNYTYNGAIYIATQASCTGNSNANNYTQIGKILIANGASNTTGVVAVPNGGGSVVKSGGTNQFTVTDAPVPTGYAVDTILTALNYFSIATANNVDFTLPLASTVQSGVYYTIQNGGSFTGVTVAPNAADLIDGSGAAITLLSRENIVLVVTAANSWSVLSNESANVPPVVPVTLSGTQTITAAQTNVGVGADGTELTLPILSSTTLGTLYTIKNFNYISVTYICNAADLIDGNAPAAITLAPQESVILQAYSAATWATV